MEYRNPLVRLTGSVALALAVLAGLWLYVEDRPLLASSSAAPLTLPDVDITVDDILASGFTQPIQVTHAGDGSERHQGWARYCCHRPRFG